MTRRTPSAALAVLLLLPAALLRADDAPKGDKDLDGTWEAVSVVNEGKEMPQPQGGKLVLTIKGDSATFTLLDESHNPTIAVDATKTPKTIDLTPDAGPQKGKTMKGIYEVKGDELRICSAQPDKDRPTDFSSKEGDGHSLMTLKRVKK